ncbi:GNAT family N-acetyltransferase [Candidatus Bathyarchaeota archaeon]|nr:MAG: GNAT family N-acetyltransferase [Candidatus Bathyarchaeota archaeon]
MFRWDLSKFNYPDSNQTEQIRVRFASESEIGTGIVVSPSYRRQGIGLLILHKTLLDLKREGLASAEVETIQGIPAAKYLYPKYGGMTLQVLA